MNPTVYKIDKDKLKLALENPIQYRDYLEDVYNKTRHLNFNEILKASDCNGCKNDLG